MAITTYVVKTTYDYDTEKVLPNTNLAGYISSHMSVETCPGEFVPASFAIKPTVDTTVTFEVTGLPWPDAVDIRVVKCWMQRGHEQYAPLATRELVPDLLLKDDSLVKVQVGDTGYDEDFVRLLNGSYVQVSHSAYTGSTLLDIMDATTLQPVTIPANTNKQMWVTIHPPETAAAGVYVGYILIKENNVTIGTMTLTITILPFMLPESPVTTTIFFSQYYDSTRPKGSIRRYRSLQQLANQMQNMKNHGILYPNIHQSYNGGGAASFNTYMNLRAQYFDNTKNIYICGWYDFIHSEYTIAQITSNTTNVKNYMYATFGTPPEQIYIYGQDETSMNTQVAYDQVSAVHALGCKVINSLGCDKILAYFTDSQGVLRHVYDYLDFGNIAYSPYGEQSWSTCQTPAINALHSTNPPHIAGMYNNPQCGEEQPLRFRMCFGLQMWKFNYDASFDYAVMEGGGCVWDDWQNTSWKQHCFILPTMNSATGEGSVIDNTGYEGFREGINDLRYLQKLVETIALAQAQGVNTSIAENYLVALKAANMDWRSPSRINLDQVRQDMITLTLNLLTAMNPLPPPDDTSTFTITVIPYGIIVDGSVSYPSQTEPGNVTIQFDIINQGESGNIWYGLYDLNSGAYVTGPIEDYIAKNSTEPKSITITITGNFHGELRAGHITT